MHRNSIQTGVWLIGLGILAFTGNWWPGIMFVIGASMIAGAIFSSRSRIPAGARTVIAPDDIPAAPRKSRSDPQPSTPAAPEEGEIPPALGSIYQQRARTGNLPEVCPNCGGPVRRNSRTLTWTGDEYFNCPYCGSDLRIES